MKLPSLEECRFFLKDKFRLMIDFNQTDQNLGVAPPPVEKPYPTGTERIPLIKPGKWSLIKGIDLQKAISQRRSRRKYKDAPLSIEELSFLLWATQGVQRKFGEVATFRTVPSAGARHALETYLGVINVEGLEPGIYRYLPLEHELLLEFRDDQIGTNIVEATLEQAFIGTSAVTFVWTTIPYRMEWRYSLAAHKVIAIDAGHVCQNLYLACEAIGAGTCAIAAYNQDLMDRLIRVDGNDEFVIYLAPVGKV